MDHSFGLGEIDHHIDRRCRRCAHGPALTPIVAGTDALMHIEQSEPTFRNTPDDALSLGHRELAPSVNEIRSTAAARELLVEPNLMIREHGDRLRRGSGSKQM